MAAERPDGAEPVEISAVEIQQEYYEAVGHTDWELFEKKDRHRLLQKIAVALCGPPTEEGDLLKNQTIKLQGYDLRSTEITMKVFKKICEQEKYSHNGSNILISTIRVVCVTPTKEVPFFKKCPADYWENLHSKKGKDVFISIFHVFCVRKCISLRSGGRCCRVFIDHDARVYNDWKRYLTENKLPKCVIIVPENGEYKGIYEIKNVQSYDNFEIPNVHLTIIPSPALGIGARVLSIADTTNTVVSLGAVAGAVGLIAAPVAAPIAVATVVAVGAATSVYGIIRSSIHLADRGRHEQNIGLNNSESRASWLNILVSTAGLSLSAAGRLVAWAASTGTNFKILLNAVQFLKYTTIASGLLGVVNGVGEMIHKYKKYNEKPTKLELFQFTSSLLFFGIGVMSNQTAQEIVEDAQAKSINNIRDSLTSNAKRKMFDKVTAETRRLQGTVKGNADIIRGIKTISDKNEFFAKLSNINKQLNVHKLRISLGSDGTTLINNIHQMTLSKLSELGKIGRDKLFATFEPAKVTTKNVPTRIYPSCAMAPQITVVKENIITNIRPEELLKIGIFIKSLYLADKNFICKLLSEISSEIRQAFMLLCIEFLNSLVPREVDHFLSLLGENWKMRIILYVYDFIVSQIDDDSDDFKSEINFKKICKEFIVDGRIEARSLEILKDKLLRWRNEERQRRPHGISDPKQFDSLYELSQKNIPLRKYEKLQAGKILKVGKHEVLIKEITIEKLQNYLAGYSQEECDSFIDFCFKVLSVMSAEEVDELNLVNIDEDVILWIAGFILENIFDRPTKDDIIDMTTIVGIKKDVMKWALRKKIRNHAICTTCKGVRYCD